MGIIKNLNFDGVNISDYGVGITGAGVYNAAERDVDMFEIPGRNGEYALDKGRFKNITLEYPAGAFDSTQSDFADKISDLRNELASRKGYKRLEDEYNPDEYRMAIFKDGFSVDPKHYSRAGEFNITFNCKPQRYLKSGETPIDVTSGDTVTNPTLFESQPLLEVEGYGDISIGDKKINIVSSPLGNVDILGQWQSSASELFVWLVNPLDELNIGDTFYVLMPGFDISVFDNNIDTLAPSPITASVSNADWKIDYLTWGNVRGKAAPHLSTTLAYSNASFTKGTNGSYSNTVTLDINGTIISFDTILSYSGDKITYLINSSNAYNYLISGFTSGINGYSTKSSLGNPIYIDCEIGEAYKIESDTVIGLNNFVSLGSDLPTLLPGSNEITYDNTITDLKIIPRYWKV